MESSDSGTVKNEEWKKYDVDDERLTLAQRFILITQFFKSPKKLSVIQRREMAHYLYLEQAWTVASIAEILLISQRVIYRDIQKIDAHYVDLIKKTTVNTWVAKLMKVADIATGMAKREGDHNAIWKINKEFFEKMQSLGYVPEAPKRLVIEDESIGSKETLVANILSVLAGDLGDDEEIPEFGKLGVLQIPADGVDKETV